MSINIQGVYAIPDEWRTIDESNPGLFGYNIRFEDGELVGGKVVPRELTVREKREMEEQAALKAKKPAPGGKKDPKEI